MAKLFIPEIELTDLTLPEIVLTEDDIFGESITP